MSKHKESVKEQRERHFTKLMVEKVKEMFQRERLIAHLRFAGSRKPDHWIHISNKLNAISLPLRMGISAAGVYISFKKSRRESLSATATATESESESVSVEQEQAVIAAQAAPICFKEVLPCCSGKAAFAPSSFFGSFKLASVGFFSTGKTSFINRVLFDEFPQKYQPTLGNSALLWNFSRLAGGSGSNAGILVS